MDWDQIGAKWQQFKGSVKQQWGELTDDDLDYVAGTRDRLVARLQEKYRVTQQQAERQADRWFCDTEKPRGVTGGFSKIGPSDIAKRVCSVFYLTN